MQIPLMFKFSCNFLKARQSCGSGSISMRHHRTYSLVAYFRNTNTKRVHMHIKYFRLCVPKGAQQIIGQILHYENLINTTDHCKILY